MVKTIGGKLLKMHYRSQATKTLYFKQWLSPLHLELNTSNPNSGTSTWL